MASFNQIMSDQHRQSEERSFDLLEKGSYHVTIVAGDVKKTKKGDGEFIELVFKVNQGPYTNRQVWMRYNTINSNPQAVEIGCREFIKCADAVGIVNPQDTDEFLDKNLIIDVDIKRETKEEGKEERVSQVIKGYKKETGEVSSAAAPGAPSAPAFGSGPKWMGKRN